MTSSPVSWQELAAVVGALVALGSVVAGAVCWILTKLHGQSLKIAALELSIAERYVTSKTHEAAEERLVGAIESMRDEVRELVRRVDWHFGWAHDSPQDRPVERKGGVR
jgi:cobalamin biosynthesis protein CobD/CbiB